MANIQNDDELHWRLVTYSFRFESDDAQASDQIHDMFENASDQRRNEGPSYVYKPFEISAPSSQRLIHTYVDWASRHHADGEFRLEDETSLLHLMRNDYGFFIPKIADEFKKVPEHKKFMVEHIRGFWYFRLFRLTVVAREITGLDMSLTDSVYAFTHAYSFDFGPDRLPDTTKDYAAISKDVAIHLGEFRSVLCSHITDLNLENISVKRFISYLALFTGVERDPNEVIGFYISAHRRLRCFDAYPFLIKGGDGYPGDVLVRLAWPRRYLSTEHSFSLVVLQYSDEARNYLTLFMLQSVAMVCTTFIMLPPIGTSTTGEVENVINLEHIDECLRLYPSHVWNTGHMPDQTIGEQVDLVDGFKLVNESMKVSLFEMDHEVDSYRQQHGISHNGLIDEELVARFIHNVLVAIICEMMGYLYCRIQNKPSVDEFLEQTEHHAARFYETFRSRSYMTDPHTTFPMQRLRSVVEQIANGAPTMGAEITFSPRTFKQKIDINPYFPRDVVHWDRNQVARRIRWRNDEDIDLSNFAFRSQDAWEDDTPILFKDEDSNQRVEVSDVPLSPFKKYDIAENAFTKTLTEDGKKAFPRLPVPPAIATATEDAITLNQTPAGSSSSHRQRQIQQAQNQFTDPVVAANRQFWPDKYYTINSNLRDAIPRELPRLQDDDVASDEEFELFPVDDRIRNNNYNQDYEKINMGDALEDLYAEILRWIVHPADHHDNGHINSSTQANAHWIKWFIRANPNSFLVSVTHADSTNDYMKHMRCYLILSIRATVRQELHTSYPLRNMQTDSAGFLRQLKDEHEPYPHFHRVLVRKVSAANKVYHVETSSNDPALVRTLAEELRGITLCIGYLRAAPEASRTTRRGDTKLIFVMIRSASFQGRNLDTLGLDGEFESVTLKVCMSKEVLRSLRFLPEADQTLHFFPLVGLSTQVRMYRSIFHLQDIPEAFRNFMFGNRNVKMYYDSKNVLQPVSRSTLTPAMAMAPIPRNSNLIRHMLADEVDPESFRYILKCLHDEHCTVDQSHFMCLVQSLRVLGHAEPGSSGLNLIQGPPGTGKTNNIIYLLGALLHHSRYGHVDREEVINYRNVKDTTLRAARDHRALKILVVASTNAAVDNILNRLHGGGIPIGNNESIYPSMLRIARYDYEPEDHLRQYLVRDASVLYDGNHEERNNPSMPARRRRADECIIFLSTNVSAAGSSLRELNQRFDVVIHDEGAYSSELETLCPLTATATKEGNNRLFYFSFGDEKQLPQLNLLKQMLISSNVVGLVPFNADTLAASFFERMIGTARCTHVFLDAQYRMHPSISRVVSLPFYGCYFKCPRPINFFLVAYNQPSADIRGFYPMTFIDTSKLSLHSETDQGNGRYINETESAIVVSIINRLHEIVGDAGLDNQIAVIAPYKAQVEHLRTAIRGGVPACRTHVTNALRNIQICTVDSMQGSQRDVVIFSTTRSNEDSKVGFTQDYRRLNVSVSRARYLNIVIADYKTISTTGSRTGNKKGIKELEFIYKMCARNEQPGARMAQAVLQNGGAANQRYLTPYQPVTRSEPRTRSENNDPLRGVPRVHDNPPNANFASLYPNPPSPRPKKSRNRSRSRFANAGQSSSS